MTSIFVALVRMWRAWRIVIPVVLVNAVLQGLLLLPGTLPYLSVPFVLVSLLSFVVLVISFGLVAAGMLQAIDGAVSLESAIEVTRQRLLPLLAWSLGLVIVVMLGLALYVVPGLVVLALTPYLLLAVIDAQPNPLGANIRAIGRHWIGWLILVVLMAVVCAIMWLLTALDGFFVTGAPGATIAWLGLGLVSAWFTCSWALLFRRPAKA